MEPRVHSTDGIAPGQRAAAWQQAIAEAYFPLRLTFRDADGFSGRLEQRRLGRVSLSRLRTEAMQFERLPQHLDRPSDEDYLVTVPTRAAVDFRQLGREVRCGPGGLLLERGGEPYRFSYAAANDLHVLKLPKAALAEKLRDPDRFCARVIDARSGLPALLVGMMGQMQSLDLTEPQAGALLGRQLVELLAVALDERLDSDEAVSSSVRIAHLRRAEKAVRQHLSNPALSPGFVAQLCGISKRYLHELFGETDRTVGRFIREERLIAARDEIAASPALPLADVAYRFGFSDQAQFSRLFKALFQMTPSDWRRSRAARSGELAG